MSASEDIIRWMNQVIPPDSFRTYSALLSSASADAVRSFQRHTQPHSASLSSSAGAVLDHFRHEASRSPFSASVTEKLALLEKFQPSFGVVEKLASLEKFRPPFGASVSQALATNLRFAELSGVQSVAAHLAKLSAMRSYFDKVKWASLEQAFEDAAELTGIDATATEEDMSQLAADMPWQQSGFQNLDVAEQVNQLVEALREQTALVREQSQSGKQIGRKDIKVAILQAVIRAIIEHLLVGLVILLSALFSSQRPADVVHEVRTIIREVPALKDEAKNYRIVGKGRVIAYQRPKTKSARVGPLVPGQMVRLVQKQKEWCLVTWHNEHGSDVQGWVKSKRLEHI